MTINWNSCIYKSHGSVPYTNAITLPALGIKFYWRWKPSAHTW